MNSRRLISTSRWIAAFGALAGIVLVYRRWLHVNPTTVALTLLLFILVLAAKWGLRYAVAVSIVATACYNFFFLPPIGTFTIADPQNWLALLAFLTTAIVASKLSERARDETVDARLRQQELEVMFQLSRELLQTEGMGTLVTTVPFAVASVTAARVGILYLLDGDRLYRAGTNEVSDVEIPHLRQLANTLGAVNCEPDEIQIPLRSGVRPRGLLVLRGASLSEKTSEAIGGLVSLAMDRAQALENLARGEAAKETERLRTLMIDSVTHELRTPLTSIKGAATTLLAGGVDAESSRELITIIDEESDRLNRLVAEAVEMAQLDTQKVQMHFGEVNLLRLVEQAREACVGVCDGHPITIDVPSVLMVNADAEFLKKVVINLLENAAKYSKGGTPIKISAMKTGEVVLVSVADRGIGIDAPEQELVFERFYRARSQSETTTGTGMGLAISRSIVEAHGGEIHVTSQPGFGSVFTFSIPLVG